MYPVYLPVVTLSYAARDKLWDRWVSCTAWQFIYSWTRKEQWHLQCALPSSALKGRPFGWQMRQEGLPKASFIRQTSLDFEHQVPGFSSISMLNPPYPYSSCLTFPLQFFLHPVSLDSVVFPSFWSSPSNFWAHTPTKSHFSPQSTMTLEVLQLGEAQFRHLVEGKQSERWSGYS